MKTRAKLNLKLTAQSLFMVLLVTGCATPRAADLQADFPEEQTQIEQRLAEIMVAAEQKDFSRLESFHFYGPKFTRFSASSPARLDAAATRRLEQDGLASLQGLKMRVEALKIDVFGHVGIATFILDYRFRSAGGTVSKKERSTLVFVNEGGEWRIAHEHLSPIMPAKEKAP